MDLKLHRDNENKIHEHLYNNLYLLSQFYPPSNDFNKVFKKDMFVKNNKAAFFEVVYYLLSTLNPEQTKYRLTMWPPYDIRRETKFRMEIISYVNELNVLYDYASIPHIMQSHLITCGGFKFTKFLLKLSELVVFEHLKKHERVELYCPDPKDNFEFHMNFFNKLTTSIENNVAKQTEDYYQCHAQVKKRADMITHNLSAINKSIVEEKKKNCIGREEFNKKYPLYPSVESLTAKTESLHKKWSSLQHIHDLFQSCGDLMNRLSNQKCLEHNKDDFKVPNKIIHIIKNRDELDLVEYFYGLNILLEEQALALPNITNSYIITNREQISKFIAKHKELSKIFKHRRKQIKEMTQDLLESIQVLDSSNHDDVQNTVQFLATL